MNTRAMSHSHDPLTSDLAAVQLDKHASARLKDALLLLLDEKPRTADELTAVYSHQAEFRRWPTFLDLHNVKRRLSDLHAKHHVIKESGEKRPSRLGKASIVWELAVPIEEARLIVAAS